MSIFKCVTSYECLDMTFFSHNSHRITYTVRVNVKTKWKNQNLINLNETGTKGIEREQANRNGFKMWCSLKHIYYKI